MQFMLALFAPMAALLAMAMLPPPANTPSLALSMSPNATDILAAHGIWAPDPVAFARGTPNKNASVDFALQSERLAHSGIDIKDLVYFTIDNGTGLSPSAKVDCSHCSLCLKACIPMLLLWPFCAAACYGQSYCHGCEPQIGPDKPPILV